MRSLVFTHIRPVRVLGQRRYDVAETWEALVDPRSLLESVPRGPGGVSSLAKIVGMLSDELQPFLILPSGEIHNIDGAPFLHFLASCILRLLCESEKIL